MKAVMQDGAVEWFEKIRRGASINQAIKEMHIMNEKITNDLLTFTKDDGKEVFIKNKTMDCFSMITQDYRQFIEENYGVPRVCCFLGGIVSPIDEPVLIMSVSTEMLRQQTGKELTDIFDYVNDCTESVKDIYTKWLYHYTPVKLYHGAVTVYVYTDDIKKK